MPRTKKTNRLMVIVPPLDVLDDTFRGTVECVEIRIADEAMTWHNVDRESIKKLHASLGRYLQTLGYYKFEEGWTS